MVKVQRKAKAIKEAAAVVNQCGDTSDIPRYIATYLADLINRELIDVEVLDVLTRPYTQNLPGNTSPLTWQT